MKSDDENLPAQASANELAKKRYVTPKLIVHGSVEKITEGDWNGPYDEASGPGRQQYS